MCQTNLKIVCKKFMKKDVWGPLIFVFFVIMTPGLDTVLFYYQINELGFTPTATSAVAAGTQLSSILGIIFY